MGSRGPAVACSRDDPLRRPGSRSRGRGGALGRSRRKASKGEAPAKHARRGAQRGASRSRTSPGAAYTFQAYGKQLASHPTVNPRKRRVGGECLHGPPRCPPDYRQYRSPRGAGSRLTAGRVGRQKRHIQMTGGGRGSPRKSGIGRFCAAVRGARCSFRPGFFRTPQFARSGTSSSPFIRDRRSRRLPSANIVLLFLRPGLPEVP
jgi:hypothetical protein